LDYKAIIDIVFLQDFIKLFFIINFYSK